MAYLRLIRPLNVSIAAGAVFVSAFVAVGTRVTDIDLLFLVLLACLVVGLITGAGNVLNDYSDREIDKENHPERPIPSGLVSPRNALSYSTVLFIIPVPLSYFINLDCFLLALFNVLVLISYERHLKGSGFYGNAAVSWLTGSIFIFGGLASYGGDITALMRTMFLGLLAFTATLGREIAKDIQDMKGDIDRKTLPREIGAQGAALIAGISFVLGIIFSLIPPFRGLLNFYYLGVVLVADVIFIYCTSLLVRNPAKASSMAKVGMVVALFAFLIGGL